MFGEWKGVSRCALLCAVAMVAALGTTAGYAGKPGGGGISPAPGTIFFRQGNSLDIWRMGGDGSGTGVALTIENDWYRVIPTLGRYGVDGHRWWLASFWDGNKGELDLYATADGAAYHQLTDCGYTDPVTSETGVVTRSLLRLISDGASWSNDGLDQFVSFPVVYAEYELGSDGQWSRTVFERAIVRLALSAGDLEQLSMPYDPVTAEDHIRLERFVTSSNGIVAQYPSHHWSPDGNGVVYELRDPTNRYDELWVADVTGGPVDAEDGNLLLSAGNSAYLSVDPPQWSRHANAADQRIAFTFDGALRTIRPDGTGAQTLATDGFAGFGTAYWSPDNQFLVCRRETRKGFKVNKSIIRVPSGGGSAVVLFTGTDAEVNKQLVGWCDD